MSWSGSMPEPCSTVRPMIVKPEPRVPRATARPRRSCTFWIGLEAGTTNMPGEASMGATTDKPLPSARPLDKAS